MEASEVVNAVLAQLYVAWFQSDQTDNMNELCAANHWPEREFWIKVDRMSADGLIKAIAFGGTYAITVRGILHAEKSGIASQPLIGQNGKARTAILDTLATTYDTDGPHAYINYQELCSAIDMEAAVVLPNLQFLIDAGYVEEDGPGERISRQGLAAVYDWRKRKAVADELSRIEQLPPHPRGRALNDLFASIVEKEGWEKEVSARTEHEEIDVVVSRQREYYLTECKWEKDPIEAAVVRELKGKLDNRAGVNGLLVSMSGFAAGAVTQAEDFASSRVILLFGPKDVDCAANGRTTFEELLTLKYKEMVTRRKAVWS